LRGNSCQADDDADDAIAQALQLSHGNFEKVQLDYKPGKGSLFHRCIINDNNIREQIEHMFSAHPPESISSIKELKSLMYEFLSSGPIWYAYTEFLERLPLNISDEQKRAVVFPFLEAADIHTAVPETAEEYLKKAGFKPEEIEGLYSKQERERRHSLGQFIDATDISPSPNITKTLEELDYAVSLQKTGAKWSTYCNYLKSLPKDTPEQIIRDIVMPLSQREGSLFIRQEAKKTLERLNYEC